MTSGRRPEGMLGLRGGLAAIGHNVLLHAEPAQPLCQKKPVTWDVTRGTPSPGLELRVPGLTEVPPVVARTSFLAVSEPANERVEWDR
jgi:hypothetical protein